MRPQKKRVLFACFVFWLGAWPADSGTKRNSARRFPKSRSGTGYLEQIVITDALEAARAMALPSSASAR